MHTVTDAPRKPTARGAVQYRRHQARMSPPGAQCSCHSCGEFRRYAQEQAVALLLADLTEAPRG